MGGDFLHCWVEGLWLLGLGHAVGLRICNRRWAQMGIGFSFFALAGLVFLAVSGACPVVLISSLAMGYDRWDG